MTSAEIHLKKLIGSHWFVLTVFRSDYVSERGAFLFCVSCPVKARDPHQLSGEQHEEAFCCQLTRKREVAVMGDNV